LVVLLSYPVEELCSALMPPRFARINGYLMRKEERLRRAVC
ncbi:unnamed protein product, partial [marine sediment metagenome]